MVAKVFGVVGFWGEFFLFVFFTFLFEMPKHPDKTWEENSPKPRCFSRSRCRVSGKQNIKDFYQFFPTFIQMFGVV